MFMVNKDIWTRGPEYAYVHAYTRAHAHCISAGFIASVYGFEVACLCVHVDRAATCYADCMYCWPISVYVCTVTTEEL